MKTLDTFSTLKCLLLFAINNGYGTTSLHIKRLFFIEMRILFFIFSMLALSPVNLIA